MKTPHKHAALIKAWADGAEIEVGDGLGWQETTLPLWREYFYYRIKPEPKPDVVRYGVAFVESKPNSFGGIKHFGDANLNPVNNLKLTFDGETGKLKSAEVIS